MHWLFQVNSIYDGVSLLKSDVSDLKKQGQQVNVKMTQRNLFSCKRRQFPALLPATGGEFYRRLPLYHNMGTAER